MVDSQCCVSFGRAYMLSYSVMSDSVTPWTVAHQAPPAMEFSRQEYWSGVPFPSPGDLPDPGIEPMYLLSFASAGVFFTTSATWEAKFTLLSMNKEERIYEL